jgi:DNA-binding transcriptional MocR family regulator
MACVDALAYWACCSGDTQAFLGGLIDDARWVDRYVVEMRLRLKAAHEQVGDALRDAGVRFTPASAGFFVLCDFREYLDESSWRAEHRLWRRILDRTGVNLTPGAACRVGEPGFMRLCFASVPTPGACDGVRRIGRLLRMGSRG